MKPFKFKPLHENDLVLLHQWFQEPTIHQWYARRKHWSLEEIKEKYEPRILGKEYVPSFIVYRTHSMMNSIRLTAVVQRCSMIFTSKSVLGSYVDSQDTYTI